MDIGQLIKVGGELGLKSEKLLEYIERKEAEELDRQAKLEKEKLDREERKEREQIEGEERKEREQIEREEKKELERLEREEKRHADKIEREERARERDEKRQKWEYEKEIEKIRLESNVKMELMEKEIELRSLNKEGEESTLSMSKGEAKSGSRAKTPRLPPFDDSKDDMDAYLHRFEKFAESSKWPPGEWAISLCALLRGKALEVYARLAPEDSNSYQKLKEALLKRYQMTEEGFRTKFRSCFPERGENATEFAVRLERYLTRWVELSKVEKTFNGLTDLLLREQFMNACSRHLVLFLKERDPANITGMAKLAEQYWEAHDGSFRNDRGTGRGNTHVNHDRRGQGQNDNRIERKDSKGEKSGMDNRGWVPRNNQDGQFNRTDRDSRRCYLCHRIGHLAKDCMGNRRHGNFKAAGLCDADMFSGDQETRVQDGYDSQQSGEYRQLHACCIMDKQVELKCGHTLPLMSAACKGKLCNTMPTERGLLNNHIVTVLRDTGCSGAVVRKGLVPANNFTGNTRACVLIDGSVLKVPEAEVFVDSPYYVGKVTVLCMENPVYDVILGNIVGARQPGDPDATWKHPDQRLKQNQVSEVKISEKEQVVQLNAVQTRAQKRTESAGFKKLKVAEALEVSVSDIKAAQATDPDLQKLRDRANDGKRNATPNGKTSWFTWENGLLYRWFKSPHVELDRLFKQLVGPKQCRSMVMHVAHESIFGGHLGVKKTVDRILTQFFWPGIHGDVTRHCRSCDVCQRTFPKGKVTRVPLGTMPVMETPFQRIATDLIGPIYPQTEKKNRYILTVVDYATRYPEAVALPGIEADRVAEALVEIFSRLGVPTEMLSDCGSQYTSQLMKEVSRLLSIKHLTTTPYRPSCNGLVEKFNGTLKSMLRKICEEKPRDWDRYIPALLFAYREAPQESLGFSPFELLYGRTVRGPMMILKELWVKEIEQPEVKTTYQYVIDLRNRLEDTCEVARKELKKSSTRYKQYYNQKSRDRQFLPKDQVLVLLPTDANKLLMQWKGPFEVIQKVGTCDYKLRQ